MPLVEISLVENALAQEQKEKMANDICDLLQAAIPNLPRHAVEVLFYENPATDWFAGGVTIAELKKRGKPD